MSKNARALLIFVIWGLVGAGIGAVAAIGAFTVGMGALAKSLPDFVGPFIFTGAFVIPIFVPASGIPVAIQVYRERPARTLGLVLGSLNLTLVAVTLVALMAAAV